MKCTHVQGGGGGGLYDEDAHVVSLTSSSFPTKSDYSVYLVEFYAPWCVLPAHLAPPLQKATTGTCMGLCMHIITRNCVHEGSPVSFS